MVTHSVIRLPKSCFGNFYNTTEVNNTFLKKTVKQRDLQDVYLLMDTSASPVRLTEQYQSLENSKLQLYVSRIKSWPGG